MKQFTKRAAFAAIALIASTSASPKTAGAAVPKACSLLSISQLGKYFPGYTVTPPNALDPYDCSWAVDGADSSEYRISITIRADQIGRWNRETSLSRRPGQNAQVPLSGLGVPAVYGVIDGVKALKAGCILNISVIGSTGSFSAKTKAIDIAKDVVAKFSV